jgi:hypothetical protein
MKIKNITRSGQSFDADTQCKYLLFDNDARMDHTAADIHVSHKETTANVVSAFKLSNAERIE